MLSRTASPSVQPGLGPISFRQPIAVAAATSSPVRNLFFGFGLILVFIRVSMVHQILTQKLGVNTYLLYIFGIPAIVGILSGGGLARAYRKRPGFWWSLFGLWILFALPFSSWRGGSVPVVKTYLRTDLIMLFVVAGLVVTWGNFSRMMRAIALAGMANLFLAKFFSKMDMNERTGLEFGTIANPNDFAGHLLFVLPFILWVVLTSKSWAVRIFGLASIAYGLYLSLATASRGAALGIVAGLIFYLIAATARQRMAMVVLAPVLLLGSISFLPTRVWERILSFSTTAGSGSEEAIESSISRSYLLRKSIEFTLSKPIFGVGAGQFSSYEGMTSRESGALGSWHDTHNSVTQISSENGIPAAFLFLGGIASTWLLLRRIDKTARPRPGMHEVAMAALCLRLSMVSFCTAILFLNFGYFFYLPMMAGLSIALASVVDDEMSNPALATSTTVVQPFSLRPQPAAWPRSTIKGFR